MSVFRSSITLLVLATAAIHIFLGTTAPTPNVLFVLNGLGYVGLLYLPIPLLQGYRTPIRIVLILYTALTIVLYFVLSGFAFDAIGYLDKLIEVALISLLIVEDRAVAREQTA